MLTNKSLPLINVFDLPYESWTKREPTLEEARRHIKELGYIPSFVNDTLKARIYNHLDAAKHMADISVDNGLERFIENQLDKNHHYTHWLRCMPPNPSVNISKYRQSYPNYNSSNVDKEINEIGLTLSDGQYLFHGGLWPNAGFQQITLTKPFSTSFCPQVALRNAEWRGKAYDAGQIDLFVLRTIEPKTNVFVFNKNDAEMGNEKEVLFSSGAKLTLCNRVLIKNDYYVSKDNQLPKTVPIYVIEVDIS
jgi:hypothetical protein